MKNLQASKEPAAFLAIVEGLEHAHGHRLHGERREKCLSAFRESPSGFARVALAAAVRANKSPLGLLCCMVDAREHTLSPSSTERPTQNGGAFVCEDCAGLSFRSEARLVEHRENVHGEW